MATKISRPNSVRFVFVGLGERAKVFKRKIDKQKEWLAHILDAASRIKKREDQLRRTTRSFTRVAKCIEVDGGVFKHVL